MTPKRSAGIMSGASPVRVVHEGRGGYVDIEDARYPIEHVGEGRFAIHVRSRCPHLVELRALVEADPARWSIDRA